MSPIETRPLVLWSTDIDFPSASWPLATTVLESMHSALVLLSAERPPSSRRVGSQTVNLAPRSGMIGRRFDSRRDADVMVDTTRGQNRPPTGRGPAPGVRHPPYASVDRSVAAVKDPAG